MALQETTSPKVKRHRIAVGRFAHESNGFNPLVTTENFLLIQRGGELMERASGSTLAGFVQALRDIDAEILPTLSISGAAGGFIAHDTFVKLLSEFLDRVEASKPDAILLELHGAMATTETPDADGWVLSALRERVGPNVPIAVGLDLHAHVTNKMLENSTICIACKENPHSDVIECGLKATRMLVDVLEGRLAPVTTAVRIPMVIPGAGETDAGPLFDIHETARRFATEHQSIEDISIYNVFRCVDDDDMGQVVTLITNGADPSVKQVARTLGAKFWDNRDAFRDNLLTVKEAFALIENGDDQKPYLLADMGDRIGAGAPGDSVVLLSEALDHHPTLSGVLTITDEKNAVRAYEVGTGAEVTLDVGGHITPGFMSRRIAGRVVHISEGEYTLAGPLCGGEIWDMGKTAVILVDDRILVILTSKPTADHDPAVVSSQGIDMSKLDFVVVKSGYHFTLNYRGLGTPVFVETPGVGYYRKGTLPYAKGRFWPEHPIELCELTATTFGVAEARPKTNINKHHGELE
ncbi:M81 family metallopeptidase [Mesorhizobium captivum]|uniref:M81 family metallopeptidase n=1 Tax=Mesorhizobium captivum TaxID=3072319 RepID=UPI002A241678|nr:M81 family metallopeptidase [Mesorhizobium sp. VK3C]MDX8450812.1 M81 family metallopeptidase [Mesorhizobium sp. VK3C]